VATPKQEKVKKAAQPTFKQYREADGHFHFKLIAADGRELLVSEGFASPKDAGELIARLKSGELTGKATTIGRLSEGVTADDVDAALATFAD
jgi:tryptophanyl-tRNA synthetase